MTEEIEQGGNEEAHISNTKRNNVYLIYNDLSIETYKNANQAFRAYNQRPQDVKYIIRGLLCVLEKVESVKISW